MGKQEKKVVPGIKKYCQVKTKLHSAKKLACQHAAEWCTMWKKWGLHDMAQHECNRMKRMHKELVFHTAKEHGPKGGKSMELVHADEKFFFKSFFNWGAPKPMPKPKKKVIKKQEKKVVPGIKKYCQVKTKLHSAKKLACEHAAEWCTMWKNWGLHDMAQHECNRMKRMHKELVFHAAKEFKKGPKGGKSMELVQADEKFFFDWGDLKIPEPTPEPKPAKKVIKKQGKKLV